jgi:hypothetical protein
MEQKGHILTMYSRVAYQNFRFSQENQHHRTQFIRDSDMFDAGILIAIKEVTWEPRYRHGRRWTAAASHRPRWTSAVPQIIQLVRHTETNWIIAISREISSTKTSANRHGSSHDNFETCPARRYIMSEAFQC